MPNSIEDKITQIANDHSSYLIRFMATLGRTISEDEVANIHNIR